MLSGHRSAWRRRGRTTRAARIAVPLAIPMALGLTLGVVLAVSGGSTTTIKQAAAMGSAANVRVLAQRGEAARPRHRRPAASPSPSQAASQTPAAAQPAAAANANMNCTLIAPGDPLSAQGLATPYQLTGPDGMSPQASGCMMANSANLGAFVQATILEPGGRLAEYDPLVVTQGTQPAAQPPVPDIPAGSVLTVDVGFNGNVLTVAGPGGQYFTQGLPGSPFGQVSFANGPAFFAAAKAANIAVPAVGTSPMDGMPCPTVHDFSLVDQDPSDNVTSEYIVTGNGQTAEDTPANQAAFGDDLAANGSDNRLLDNFVDPALGCTPFEVPSLSDPNTTEATQATDELLADADQQAPIALVETNDPMTTVGADADVNANDLPAADNLSADKTDLYRASLGQPLLTESPVADATSWCQNLQQIGAPRLALDAKFETGPSPQAGENLAQFMANRYATSVTLDNCKLFGGVFIATVPGSGGQMKQAQAAPPQAAPHQAAPPQAAPPQAAVSSPPPPSAPPTASAAPPDPQHGGHHRHGPQNGSGM
jgi:hypothetical protein